MSDMYTALDDISSTTYNVTLNNEHVGVTCYYCLRFQSRHCKCTYHLTDTTITAAELLLLLLRRCCC
jgi:hypothetical protein